MSVLKLPSSCLTGWKNTESDKLTDHGILKSTKSAGFLLIYSCILSFSASMFGSEVVCKGCCPSLPCTPLDGSLGLLWKLVDIEMLPLFSLPNLNLSPCHTKRLIALEPELSSWYTS